MTRRAGSADQLFVMRDVLPPAERAALDTAVAAEAERQAWYWRLRLVGIETVMMAALVLAAGLALGQPAMLVARAAVIIAAACFTGCLLLIWLSGLTGQLMSRWRAGRRP